MLSMDWLIRLKLIKYGFIKNKLHVYMYLLYGDYGVMDNTACHPEVRCSLIALYILYIVPFL